MTTIILTIIITIIAYQLIIFIVSLADLYDNENMQLVLCGVWSLILLVIVRPIVKLYRKCQLRWFNTHYTRCIFHTKREGKTDSPFYFYVKNTEIDKLNQDKSKTRYIELNPERKAKNLLDVHIKRNRGSGFLTDLSNPPTYSGYSGDYIAQWLK
jgi:hypothetical protein